jgi:hypothetical protein
MTQNEIFNHTVQLHRTQATYHIFNSHQVPRTYVSKLQMKNEKKISTYNRISRQQQREFQVSFIKQK